MLQDLPSPKQQQQQPQQQHKQKHSRPAPVKTQQQQALPLQQPHTVNVPVTISMSGQGGRGQQESPPVSPGTAKDPNGESLLRAAALEHGHYCMYRVVQWAQSQSPALWCITMRRHLKICSP